MKPWLTERELDVLRAIKSGDVIAHHRRHRWAFLRRNVGPVTPLIERLEAKEAITISHKAGGTPEITIRAEALPLLA